MCEKERHREGKRDGEEKMEEGKGREGEREHARNCVYAGHGTCVEFRENFVKSVISLDLLMCP